MSARILRFKPAPEPDDATKAIHSNATKLADSVLSALAAAEADWIDGWMNKILPPNLYEKTRLGISATDRKGLIDWMNREDVRVEVFPGGGKILKRGNQTLGVFEVKMIDGKFKVLTQDLTEDAEDNKD